MAILQVYILSRDRPIFLKQAIDSVLNQKTLIEFELIISDNSEGIDVNKMIAKNYSKRKFKYSKVNPPLPANDHFQLVVSKLNTEFAILLHDDDIVSSNYIKNMFQAINEDNLVAVGCNATIFKNNILDTKKNTHSFVKAKKFNNEKNFLSQYLPGNKGNAPYPSYIYRTKYLKKAFSNIPIQGKHSDVAMLSSLLHFGEILWLEKKLMYYRVHNSNDSATESITDRIKLMNYMKKKGIDRNCINFVLFRVSFWIRWIGQQSLSLENLKNLKFRKVLISILLIILKLSYRLNFWLLIFQRYQKK
tara:strand:- start:305 stop:1216 length:912 start_codon:yes stop_codon:yes gene_type:complete